MTKTFKVNILSGFLLLLFTLCIHISNVLPQDKPSQKKLQHSKTCPKECQTCKTATDKALKYLSEKVSSGFRVPSMQDVVRISLVGLAFMSEGSTPSKGQYSKEVSKCVEDTLSNLTASRSDKLFANWRLSFAILFLIEVYNKEQDDKIKKILVDIGKELELNQEKDGGWAHGPKASPGDTYRSLNAATTVCLAALINLKKAGIPVDEKVIKQGTTYMEKSTIENPVTGGTTHVGSVGYSVEKIEPNAKYGYPSPAITALAIYDMIQLGNKTKSASYGRWIDYLRIDLKNTLYWSHGSFHLCFLYTAIGSHKLGANDWKNFKIEWLDYLLNTQNGEGISQRIADNTTGLHAKAKGHNAEDHATDDTYRTAILAI